MASNCIAIAVAVPFSSPPLSHKSSNNKLRNLTLQNPKHNLNILLTKPIKPNKKPTTTTTTTGADDKNSNSWVNKIKQETDGIEKDTTSDILRLMDSLSLPIPSEIYSSLIQECTFKHDSTGAYELISHIKNARLKPTLPFINRILLMHVSCSHLTSARQLFDQMPQKDLYSWAIIILAYFDVGHYEEGIMLFVFMFQNGESRLDVPNWIIVRVLKACVFTMNMELGKQIHCLLFKQGASSDLSISGSLISFYGQFNCSKEANFIFDQLYHHNIVVWTAKIVNNGRDGNLVEVIRGFNEIGRLGIKKNAFTISSVLKACCGNGKIDEGVICGREVHANAIKLGLESNAFVRCGLVDLYGKCGLLIDSKNVFEECNSYPLRRNGEDPCWNAMLMAYVRNGLFVEAIKFLYRMKADGVHVPDSILNDVRIGCSSMI